MDKDRKPPIARSTDSSAAHQQFASGRRTLDINPPRMPLGYLVESYPAAVAKLSVARSPNPLPNPILENNTFIPGESLPSTLTRSAMQTSPIDFTRKGPAARSSRSSADDDTATCLQYSSTRSGTPISADHTGGQQVHENVIMQCEEIAYEDGFTSNTIDNRQGVETDDEAALFYDPSFDSDDASMDDNPSEGSCQDENLTKQAEETACSLPYTEVSTQRSVAYVIDGYAYTKNRQQSGKIYLRCRQRGCGARAMVMTNVHRATVFNNAHNHPPRMVLTRRAIKRRNSHQSAPSSPEGKELYLVSPLPPKLRLDYRHHSLVYEAEIGSHGRVSRDDTTPRILNVQSLHKSEMVSTVKSRLPEFLEKMEKELDRVVDFWLTNSHDAVNGGFFTCLGRDGKQYDDLKYCWLQGRQVWMYCKLYNSLPKYRTPEILQAAKKGGDFLMNYAKNPTTNKCYFILTKEGKAVKVQRTIFSECFYVMAMSELARATHNNVYKEEAIKMLDQLQHWVCVDDTGLGRPQLMGAGRVNSLSVGMIFLNLLDELTAGDVALQEKYAQLEKWSIEQSLQHMQRDGNFILETVSTEGKEMPGSAGRLMNPGHAIETGWFLLQCATKHSLATLQKIAIDNFIIKPFRTGWDVDHGGLFSFLDVDNLAPTQLEWNMKLWWPHCEALVAFLMAYRETSEERFLELFEKVYDYTLPRFVDPDHGEWFGYLNQEGKVSLDFKGGPYKGCFHVPRCLFMCTQMLRKILKGE